MSSCQSVTLSSHSPSGSSLYLVSDNSGTGTTGPQRPPSPLSAFITRTQQFINISSHVVDLYIVIVMVSLDTDGAKLLLVSLSPPHLSLLSPAFHPSLLSSPLTFLSSPQPVEADDRPH